MANLMIITRSLIPILVTKMMAGLTVRTVSMMMVYQRVNSKTTNNERHIGLAWLWNEPVLQGIRFMEDCM